MRKSGLWFMKTIRLATWIDAPIERCFLLSLSMDLHVASTWLTREKAVAGVTTGLIGLNQTVTWSGYHFGLRLQHTSLIDAFRPYTYFRDVMVEGMFSHFEHEHHFAVMDDGTRMRDEVRFSAPLGPLGGVAEKLVLRRYLIQLLKRRNAVIKEVAESDEWQRYLVETSDEPGADAGPGLVDGWEEEGAEKIASKGRDEDFFAA